MVRLPDGEKTLRICLTVLAQYWHVTDRWTDRQTDILPRHSLRYAYASCGKNQVYARSVDVHGTAVYRPTQTNGLNNLLLKLGMLLY